MTVQTSKPKSLFNCNTKVSIIIPCYNQGEYVLDTINSVLNQTYQNIEVIVVDDGSNDPYTLSVFNQFNNKKICVINTSNQGLAAARNNGIQEATGEYILPLDADDLIAPSYVEKAITVLKRTAEIGIVYCRAQLFGAVDSEWQLPPFSMQEMLKDNVIFCTAMFRKSDWEEVGGYDPGMIYGWEDYDFWLSLIERGCGVYQIPEILFHYRVASDSMVRSKEKWQKAAMFKRIFQRHQKLFSDNIDVWINTLLDAREKYYTSKLYFDTGRGVSDEEAVSRKVDRHTYEVQFNLPKGKDIKAVRFDPVDCPVVLELQKVKITNVQGDSWDLTSYSSNCDLQSDGESYFASNDPMYFFHLSLDELTSVKTITVRLIFKALGEEALESIVSKQREQIQRHVGQLEESKSSGAIKALGKAIRPLDNENVLKYFKRQLKPF